MSNQPQLTLTVQSGLQAGQTFRLAGGSQTIGRTANNQIVINDPTISRQHARITVQPNGVFIQDLGSANGTFVNGQRITNITQLRPGDVLQVGTSVTLGVQSGAGLMPIQQPGYALPSQPVVVAPGSRSWGFRVIVALVAFLGLVGIGIAALLVWRIAQPTADQTDSAGAPAPVEMIATEEPTPEPAPEVVINFTADKTTVQLGECATLRWNAANAEEVRLDGEIVPSEGNRKVCPQEASKTYRLTALSPDGEVMEEVVSMTVPPTLPPPPGVEIDFTADQTTVGHGGCTTLRWTVKNAQVVRLDGEKVSARGTQEVCPEESANTYQLLVDPLEGELVERMVIINVPATPTPAPTATPTPKPQPQNPAIDKFIADQYTLNQGNCTTLRWTVRNAQTVRLDGNQVAGQGSQRVCPTASSNVYNLVVTGQGGGSVQSSVQISVIAPTFTPVIVIITQPPPPTPSGPPKYDIGASVGYIDGNKRCFTLQGYMENVKAAYLDGGEFNNEPLTGPSWAKKVCHKQKTTYVMIVELPDGSFDAVSVTREGP